MADNTIAQITSSAAGQTAKDAPSGRPFIPPTKRTKPIKLNDFHDNYKELAGGFGIAEAEIKEWIKSDFFDPFWQTYLQDYLTPAREKAKAMNARSITGVSLKTVLARIAQGERLGMAEYSKSRPKKENWKDIDHHAYFLVCCNRENEIDRNGIFYGRKWTEGRRYHAIWQAKTYLTNYTNKSRDEKRQEQERKRLEKENTSQRRRSAAPVPSTPPSTTPVNPASIPTTGSRLDLPNPIPSGAPAVSDNNAEEERKPKRVKIAGHASSSHASLSESKSGLIPTNPIVIDSDESDDEFIPKVEESDSGIFVALDELEDDIEFQENQSNLASSPRASTTESERTRSPASEERWLERNREHEERKRERERQSRQEQPSSSAVNRERSSTVSDEPQQTEWETIVAEAAGKPFDLSIRYWQIQTVHWLIEPEKMPRYAQDILANLAPEQAETLNEMSLEWYKQFTTMGDKKTIIDTSVNDDDRRNSAKGEEFLNTTPNVIEDITNAMEQLSMTHPDPRPRFKAMSNNIKLLPLQIVGILRLIKMKRTLKAGLLSDSTGLGKTFQMLGVNLHGIEEYQTQKAAAIASNREPPAPRPSLILVPHHLIEQTYNEITSVLRNPRDVFIYYGDPRDKGPLTDNKVKGIFTRDHDFFSPGQYGPDPATRIVITTPSTFTTRHGPRAFFDWLVNDQRMDPVDAKKIKDSPTSECPAILNGLFGFVAIDECHVAKNASSEINNSLRCLDPNFTLLMSATPGINSIADYEGYFKLIQPRNPPMGEDGSQITRPESINHNPYEREEEEDLLLRINPILLNHYIFSHVDPTTAAVHLRKALEVCMIRRTFATLINGEPVGDSLPKLFRMDVEVEYNQQEQDLYNKYAEKHFKKLFIPLKDGKVGLNMGKARHLSLNSSWIGYEYVSDLMKADDIPKLKKEKHWLHRMLTVLKKKREENNEPVGWSVPDKSDVIGQTAIVLRESPKFQALLGLCADRVVRKKKKVIVFCSTPAQQILATEILRNVGIDAEMLSADLKISERTELVENFTTTDKVQVLVMTYSVSLCGLNLQHMCADAIHIDIPSSRDTRMQADGRIRRHGQKHNVRSWSITTKQTFNDYQEDNSEGKGVTGILTELNSHLFNFVFAEDDAGESVPELRGWVICNGRLLKAGDPGVRADSDVEQADLDRIAKEIYLLEKGRVHRVRKD